MKVTLDVHLKEEIRGAEEVLSFEFEGTEIATEETMKIEFSKLKSRLQEVLSTTGKSALFVNENHETEFTIIPSEMIKYAKAKLQLH